MPLSDCRLIELPKIVDPRGNLSFAEGDGRHVPFPIRRVWYSYDIPDGSQRGGHAHKKLQQFHVVLVGGMTVVLDDGQSKQSFLMNAPNLGIYVAPGIWVDLNEIHGHCVCLTLASDYYDESDYLRNYDDFLAWTQKRRNES
jgi:dTDP-4-dehydrorhamnose 3,5-epimerase-like enzyme